MTAKYSTFTFYEPNRSKRSQKLSVHRYNSDPPPYPVLRITVFICLRAYFTQFCTSSDRVRPDMECSDAEERIVVRIVTKEVGTVVKL